MKGVKFEVCIQPAADGRMLVALPGNKLVAVSERRWPRLLRLLTAIYENQRDAAA